VRRQVFTEVLLQPVMVLLIGARHVTQLFEILRFSGDLLPPPVLIIHVVSPSPLSIYHLDTPEQISLRPVQLIIVHPL